MENLKRAVALVLVILVGVQMLKLPPDVKLLLNGEAMLVALAQLGLCWSKPLPPASPVLRDTHSKAPRQSRKAAPNIDSQLPLN